MLIAGVVLAVGILGSALLLGRDHSPVAGTGPSVTGPSGAGPAAAGPAVATPTAPVPAAHTVDLPPAQTPTSPPPDTLSGAFPVIDASGGCGDVADLNTDTLTVGDTTATAARSCVPDPGRDTRVIFLQWSTPQLAEQFRQLSDPASSTQRTWGRNGTVSGTEVDYVSSEGYTVQELHLRDSRYVALVMAKDPADAEATFRWAVQSFLPADRMPG